MEGLSKIKADLLREEYIAVHNTIEDMDRKALLIKGWYVTVVGGLISLKYETVTQNFILACVIIPLIAVIFLIMEYLWKRFQYCHYERIKSIEEVLNSPNPDLDKFNIPYIYHSWKQAWKGKRPEHHRKLLKSWHFWLPHVPLALVAPLLWVLN